MPTVLIAEDEYLVRVGLRTCIPWEQHGFTLLEDASDGVAAYERIREQRPDILLLDIKMPRMDGFELLRRLKEEGIEQKTIILSCYDDFDSVRTALQMGVVDYINKLTLNPKDLLEVLKKVPIPSETAKIAAGEPVSTLPTPAEARRAALEQLAATGSLPPDQTQAIFPEGYVVCLQLRFSNGHNALSSSACLNVTTQILKNSGIESATCSLPSGTVCILLPQQVPVKDLVSSLRGNLETTLGACCSIGISPPYRSPQKAGESLQLARQIETLRFFDREGQTLFFEQELTASPQTMEQFQQVKNQIKNNLAAQNAAGTLEVLEHFFDTFSKCPDLSPKEFTKFALTLLDLFRLESMESRYFQCQNDIAKADTAKQMQQTLLSFVNLYFSQAAVSVDSYSSAVSQVIQYLIQNTNRFVPLSEAAQYVNMSESYLSWLFKKETGETYTNYTHRYKIQLAKKMLQDKMLVYEVCDQIGFENPNYFSKIFKRFTGLTPNEYKNQWEGEQQK